MDIRLKRFSRSNWTKAVTFLLIVAMVAGISGIFVYWLYSGINPEVLITEDYKKSEVYRNDVRNLAHDIVRVMEGEQETLPWSIKFYGEKGMEQVAWPHHITEESFLQENHEYFYHEDGVFKNSETDEYVFLRGVFADTFDKAYFSLENGFLQQKQQDWSEGRDFIMPYAIAVIGMIVGIILLLVYLFVVTGKKVQDEEIHLAKVDKIYLEVFFFGLLFLAYIWIAAISQSLHTIPSGVNEYGILSSRQKVSIYLIMIFTAFITGLTGIVLLSFVRRIKVGDFFKSSLIYRVFYKGIVYLRSSMDGSRFTSTSLTRVLYQRQIYFVIGSFLLVLGTIFFGIVAGPLIIIPPILEGLLIYWYFKYNKETFDEIDKGFDESLEEQIKSERMKINLVTNVSHDLKTPLTSIISYVDLLSREEGLSDNAKDYVKILSQKSERLKNIVADLFELARSTSGDIDTDFEKLDFKKLLEQTLVDMEDSIKSSGFQVRTSLPDEPVYIMSDGKKLYRVIQNLLDNALKYSLVGTRIYIELSEDNDKGNLRIKNTADYEMNFTKEEILQRFFRGDQSRSSDGTGLGLSIAESFTRVCGGEFDIKIDGDQFCVFLKFPIENKFI